MRKKEEVQVNYFGNQKELLSFTVSLLNFIMQGSIRNVKNVNTYSIAGVSLTSAFSNILSLSYKRCPYHKH